MLSIRERRAAAFDAAQAVIAQAKAEGGTITNEQNARLEEYKAEIVGLDATIARIAETPSLSDLIGRLPGGDDSTHLALTGPGAKSFARNLASKMLDTGNGGGFGQKALIPAGAVAVSTPTSDQSPIAMGRVPSSLLDTIPLVVRESPRYTYLRQSTRTNNAAPVAPGALKPTTVLGVVPIEAALTIVAHLSEPVDKYLLADVANLTAFVQDEMLYGLAQAVEGQVVNGTGSTPNIRGLLNTSGIQSVTAASKATGDLFQGVRTGITMLETVGQAAGVLALNPLDWQRIELGTNSVGDYYLTEPGGPVDRAARRLWGVQVITCLSLAQGTGVLFDPAALTLDTDRQGIEVRWSESVGTDFQTNQVRCRAEGRWNLAVTQPAGVVKLTLPVT